jgi:hypothetical protein
MRDAESLRERLVAARVELPEEILQIVVMAAGPLITALDELIALDLGTDEPFMAGQRLSEDAAA